MNQKLKEFAGPIAIFFIIVIALYFNIENELTIRINHLTENAKNVVAFDVVKEKGNISIYFCPKDNCEEHLNDLIKSANESVYCAFYDVKLDSLAETIGKAKKEGIDVKIIIDDHTAQNKNSKYDELGQILGENIKTDEKRSTGKYNNLMHDKFCVIDNKTVFTGSFNPTDRGAHQNNNNMLVITSEYLAKNYMEEFYEMQNDEFGDRDSQAVSVPVVELENTGYGNVKIENYFCPEDNCKKHVIDTINSANSSIYFCTFSFTEANTRDALLNATKRGVKIYGLFDKTQAGSKYSVFDEMKNQNNSNIYIYKDSNPAFMHHKFFVIDEIITITGSMNPTQSGYFYNDENIIIIENPLIGQMYKEEYDSNREN